MHGSKWVGRMEKKPIRNSIGTLLKLYIYSIIYKAAGVVNSIKISKTVEKLIIIIVY